MKRTFKVTVKISGQVNNWDNKDGITTFRPEGNARSTQNSIINGIKRDLSKTGCKLEEIIDFTETTNTSEEPKKTTSRRKRSTTVTVVLKAFTGMIIGTYTAEKSNKLRGGYKITTKNGKEMEFNLDGTQRTPSKNPKFNNRIEIVAEA